MGKTDYEVLHKDYSESIDALQRAIAVLAKQTRACWCRSNPSSARADQDGLAFYEMHSSYWYCLSSGCAVDGFCCPLVLMDHFECGLGLPFCLRMHPMQLDCSARFSTSEEAAAAL